LIAREDKARRDLSHLSSRLNVFENISMHNVYKLLREQIIASGGIGGILKRLGRVYRAEGRVGVLRKARGLLRRFHLSEKPVGDRPPFLEKLEQFPPRILVPHILIIAEMSVPQCTKYRVTQKKEIIERLGFKCTVKSWTESRECIHYLSL